MSDPYSVLIAGFTWSQVGVDLVVIFAALAAVFVISKGGQILLRAVGGGSAGPAISDEQFHDDFDRAMDAWDEDH